MDTLLDMDGLAEYLGMSKEWVRKRVKNRQIPFTRIGDRHVRFTPEHVAAITAAGEQPVDPKASA